ncbi:MAG: lipopolysaccharide heptosyltransferase II [Verrucomicrobiia bacterium]
MPNQPPASIPAAPKPGESPPSPRRILVRGTNWLGDAVMTTPALLRLREKFPQAHIALLTPEKLRDLWIRHPAVDETLVFAPDDNVLSVAWRLRAGKFDVALVLPNSPRSAIETWLAGISQRIGYARPWRNGFLTRAVAPRADAVEMHQRSVEEINRLIARNPESRNPNPEIAIAAHQINDYLHLAAVLGANPEPLPPMLAVTQREMEAARKKFSLSEIKRPIFGLNPGAEYGPAKRWPVEKFIAAASEIQHRTSCTWLTFGGEADAVLAHRIESAIPSPPSAVYNLAGKTTLRELMALLKICRVLLSNDTGPMHIAAALGTPVVAPFGSTSPELTGPGLPDDPRHRLLVSDAPCSPCFLRECPINFRCMNGISVERVVEAVMSRSGVSR